MPISRPTPSATRKPSRRGWMDSMDRSRLAVHYPLSARSASHKCSSSVTLPYSPLPKARRMSVASTTSVDGIELGRAAAARRHRLRLLPYLLLAPSLLFLVLFTYLPVVRVAIESLFDTP